MSRNVAFHSPLQERKQSCVCEPAALPTRENKPAADIAQWQHFLQDR